MELKIVDTLLLPMLAQEVTKPFNHEDWLFEIKWDGYRALAQIKQGEVHLTSRSSVPLNNSFPTLVQELEKVPLNVVVDGEIVLLNEKGKPDFQKLQNYRHNPSSPLYFYVFDILYFRGESTCDLPLIKRKQLLKRIFPWSEHIRFTDHVIGEGIAFFESIRKLNMEGVIAKKIDGLYYPGRRTSLWLKIKQNTTADALIAGFTQPSGSRKYFGSLVLAFQKDNQLVYAGHAGTGFDNSVLKSIYLMLYPLIISDSPFAFKVKTKMPITWVHPELTCEVKYSELTFDGIMRHPVFLRMRSTV